MVRAPPDHKPGERCLHFGICCEISIGRVCYQSSNGWHVQKSRLQLFEIGMRRCPFFNQTTPFDHNLDWLERCFSSASTPADGAPFFGVALSAMLSAIVIWIILWALGLRLSAHRSNINLIEIPPCLLHLAPFY
jgi:hypothetical protein